MRLILAFLLALGGITCGVVFQYMPYYTHTVGYGAHHPLAHRDSAYSSITWMVSEEDNYQQLKFFDRVEGGICLRPSWSDIIALADKEPSLRHLLPSATDRPKPGAAGGDWPNTWMPDPGTVANSPYIRMFPIGVLLNNAVMTKAGGVALKAEPKVLVVGLGSGVGIANLAHHFPQASITVVDIDHVVEDMVRDYYPLLAWLLTQKTANGEARLRFEVRDARQFIRYDAKREVRPYDMVVLDAYTSGSTIPPHLMTLEFFATCADILSPDGIVFANVIGSYTGDKRLVSGGAMRTFRAAGLTHLWNFPVLQFREGPGNVDPASSRNNIVVCSRKPIDPRGNAAGWERLKQFEPYQGLGRGMSVNGSYAFIGADKQFVTAAIPSVLIDNAAPSLKSRMNHFQVDANQVPYPNFSETDDRALMNEAAKVVDEALAKGTITKVPYGWGHRQNATTMRRWETDWVLAARAMFHTSVMVARDPKYDGESLVGPLEDERATIRTPTWLIKDAPLFTDQMPNADILNN